MSAKFLAFLLASLLLVNHCIAAPASSEESKESSEENDLERMRNYSKLAEILVDEIIALHKMVLKDGKEVLEKVLTDPKVLEVKSEAMQENLKDIREYVEKLHKDEKGSQKIFEYEVFEEHINKYKKEKNENLSKEEEIIGNSLKENGLEAFEEAVEKHFKAFLDDFTVKVGSYIEKISDKKLNNDEKQAAEWLEKAKKETDILKQFEIFKYYFTTDNESE